MKKIALILSLTMIFKSSFSQNIVYYTSPNAFDTLTRWAAQDVSILLTQATGNTWTYQQHLNGALPNTGLILHADSMMLDHRPQYCEIVGTANRMYFHSKYARGIMFGVYEYLRDLGFRFYLPDDHWNVIPQLSSPYTIVNTIKQPIASMREPMMNGTNWVYYPPDPNSQSIQEYTKFLLRNSMLSERQPQGHNEGFDQQYIDEITSDPCFTAEYDANSQMIPEYFRPPNVLNNQALDIWARYINRNVSTTFIYNDPILNSRDPYYNGFSGIEVADATRWGNTDTEGCVGGPQNWPTPSTQMNLLCNYTTEYLINQHPDRTIQTLSYAYDTHADTPNVVIHPNRHISFTRGYNVNGSDVGILHRWKAKLNADMSQFMDYNYFNLGYGGIPPYSSKVNFENMLKRNRNWGCEGVMYETRASKFSTGIYWRTWNEFLKNNADLDSTWNDFYSVFNNASPMMKELFEDWSSSDKHTDGVWVFGNKWRYPKWIKLIQDASISANGDIKTQQKLNDVKAYMHYLILDSKLNLYNSNDTLRKGEAAENLIRFLAQTSNRNLFIHGGMIDELVNRLVVYTKNDTIGNSSVIPYFNYWKNFFWNWSPNYYDSVYSIGVNPYLNSNGNLSPLWQTITPLSDNELEILFQQDLAEFPYFTEYSLLTYEEQIEKIATNQLGNKDTVQVKHNNYMVSTGGVTGYSLYTNNPTQVKIIYDSLRCDEVFGVVCDTKIRYNIVIDAYDEEFSKEYFINSEIASNGELTFDLPRSGWYSLSFVKMDVGGAQFKIVPGHALVVDKNAKFPMWPGESHPVSDYPHFYVPENVQRVYFSLYGHSPTASPLEYIQATTHIINPNGEEILIQKDLIDSNLFYFETAGFDENFWKMYTENGESYDFVNISNTYFWLDNTNNMGLKNMVSELDFKLYPNPTSGTVNIEVPDEFYTKSIGLFDVFGRVILEAEYSNQQSLFEFQMNNFNKGVYIVQLINQNGEVVSKRFIKH